MDRPVQGGDDAYADALVQSERIADRDGRLAEQEIRRDSQWRRRELSLALDLEDGEIAAWIGADHARRVVGAVVEADLDAASARDHVIIGEHESALVEYESGAQRRAHLIARPSAEEELPGVVGGSRPHHFLRVDVDHGLARALHRQHQRRTPRGAGRRRQRSDQEERDHSARRAQLAERSELRLDAARLFGEVFERLEVPLVFLLVQQTLLDVPLDHPAIQVPERDLFLLFGHCAAPSVGRGF